jgi:predicted lipoprotein
MTLRKRAPTLPLLLLPALPIALGSCIESTSSSNVDSGAPGVDAGESGSADSIRAVLANVGGNVALATYRRLASDVAALEAATAALAADPSDANRDAARAAYVRAMDRAQRAEVFQLGPAAPLGTTPGALALRDEIYAWPLVNACRIDQETVTTSFETTEGLAAEALNVRGLGALEYLLFEETGGNACPPTASINTMGSWAALGAEGVRARRATYAHTATRLARAEVDALVAAWEGGFLEQLRTAGAGSGTYASAQEGLNALSDALFYVYEPLLDMKLGTPAGMYTCVTATCPEAVESPWRDRAAGASGEGGSLPALVANLEAFRAGYLGHDGTTDGPGLDDLLREVGATDLDGRMQAAIDAAIEAVEAIEGPLSVAVVERPAQVAAAIEAVDALTLLLKTEVITVLDLELPMRAEGDND